MVPDTDKEPKAAVALLAWALGDSETSDSAPTVGAHSAEVLGDEIAKYLDCHRTEDEEGNLVSASKLLRVHAIRAGDGLTVARSLGRVHELHREDDEIESGDGNEKQRPAACTLKCSCTPY